MIAYYIFFFALEPPTTPIPTTATAATTVSPIQIHFL